MPLPPRPVILCILDGWGCSENPNHNAIAAARTPNWDELKARYPLSSIDASESHVGLPDGQMGNSEVGHMNIGAGRVMMQELPKIDAAIDDGSLATNPALRKLIETQKQSGLGCHLIGLLSDGGVHSHQRHLEALAEILSAEGIPVWLHAILDGRDTPPKSAATYLARWNDRFAGNERVKIATISGRYHAMDRDKRWDRVQKAYAAMADAGGPSAPDVLSALKDRYAAGETDEFVTPTKIDNGGYRRMLPGEALIMANFRADRARELMHALLDPAFDAFPRYDAPEFSHALGMVEYSTELNALMGAMYPQTLPERTLGEIVSAAGYKQLRIAETEKYAHVSFFFSGGREEPFAGEERILIPSPSVATYDLKPEMSAPELTDRLVSAIETGGFHLIVANYANADMVGHSGNLEATTLAIEAVDACLGRVAAAAEAHGCALLVTADHGNAEQMQDPTTGEPHTAHTVNRVPLLLATREFEHRDLRDGRLADIAPTVLALLGLPQPAEMTGASLLPAADARARA